VKVKKAWEPDAEACPICEANGDQGAIDLDDDFESGDDAPPAHPNCFLEGTPILAFGVSKSYKRWFQGKITTIQVAGNHEISVTPNHPILTQRGWVVAGSLQVGDGLAQCVDPFIVTLNPDDNYIEATIENVSDALGMTGCVSARAMKTASEDFHGDGVIDGEVDVIYMASPLTNNVARNLLKTLQNLLFGSRNRRKYILASKSALALFVDELFAAPSCSVGSSHAINPFFGRATAGLHSASIAVGANGKTKLSEARSNRGTVDTDAVCEIDAAFSSKITFVKITNINVRKFSGHVYNMETNDGWYLANSIIVSNCECVLVPEVGEDDDDE
jgi:hypothetical protein